MRWAWTAAAVVAVTAMSAGGSLALNDSNRGREATSSQAPGALVRTTLSSQVGVVLDEIPASMRARVASALIGKPGSFWVERAKAQLRLTTYRLVYRQSFYDAKKHALPLPPEPKWQIRLVGTPHAVQRGWTRSRRGPLHVRQHAAHGRGVAGHLGAAAGQDRGRLEGAVHAPRRSGAGLPADRLCLHGRGSVSVRDCRQRRGAVLVRPDGRSREGALQRWLPLHADAEAVLRRRRPGSHRRRHDRRPLRASCPGIRPSPTATDSAR